MAVLAGEVAAVEEIRRGGGGGGAAGLDTLLVAVADVRRAVGASVRGGGGARAVVELVKEEPVAVVAGDELLGDRVSEPVGMLRCRGIGGGGGGGGGGDATRADGGGGMENLVDMTKGRTGSSYAGGEAAGRAGSGRELQFY